MKKIVSLVFLLSFIIAKSQTSVQKPGWLLGGNPATTPGTNFIGTTDPKDLIVKTNNATRITVKSNGVYNLAATTSTGTVAGDQWFDAVTYGLSLYTPTTVNTWGRTHHNNGGVKVFEIPVGNGNTFYDGGWIGTATAHNYGIIANGNGGGAPSVVITGEGIGQQGALLVNPVPLSTSHYSPVAMFEVIPGASTIAFRTNTYITTGGSTNSVTPIVEFNTLTNAFTKPVRIGSQVAPTATLDVTGNASVSISLSTPLIVSPLITGTTVPNGTLNVRSASGLNRGIIKFGRIATGGTMQFDEIPVRFGIGMTNSLTARLNIGNAANSSAVPGISFESQSDPLITTQTGDMWRNSTGFNIVGPLITSSLTVPDVTVTNLTTTSETVGTIIVTTESVSTLTGTNVIANNFTLSTLGSSRIAFGGTGGKFTDNANLTFAATTGLSTSSLTLSGNLNTAGTTTLNGALINTSLTVSGANTPLIISSTNSNGTKIALSDAGVARGYIGCTSGEAFSIWDNAAAGRKFTVSNTGNGVIIGTFSVGSTFIATGASSLTSVTTAYVAKTGAYTITNADYTIDCTANTFTVTLPAAASNTGRIFVIKNSGAGTITLQGSGGAELIDGTTSKTLSVQYSGLTVQSTGTKYITIGSF